MKKELKKLKLLLTALTLSGVTLTSCAKVEQEKELTKVEIESQENLLKPKENTVSSNEVEEELKEPEIAKKEIVISAVGDCTLGTDTNFGDVGTFPSVLDENNHDYSYFFRGVYDVLSEDDLTIANLETTFTDATERVDKKFNFKGDADYTNILIEGSVEAVNLANNHTYDYGQKGYDDTIMNLNNAGIPYFGYDNYAIQEIDGIKVGMAGITGWNETEAKNNTDKAITYFKENNTDLIIMTYHWGIEREYKQTAGQENIARYAIDNGADLVLGHHPHVLQGIENYNGKYIVYSLGNFVFGGNKNPKDKDTMIFQETFCYENGKLVDTKINIIPCSLSSRTDLNDYQPIVLEGDAKVRVLKKIEESSENLEIE